MTKKQKPSDSWFARPTIVQQQARIAELTIERDELRKALAMLYEDTADYIRLNNLGDVHHNRAMQLAREALKKGDVPTGTEDGSIDPW